MPGEVIYFMKKLVLMTKNAHLSRFQDFSIFYLRWFSLRIIKYLKINYYLIKKYTKQNGDETFDFCDLLFRFVAVAE